MTRIISGKLRAPAQASAFVPRPRLVAEITSLLGEHRVLVVAATAGSGKTSAVAEALACSRHHVAWLTVDHSDAAASRLLPYLAASVEAVAPTAPRLTAGALAEGLTHPEIAGLLADAIRKQPLVLVIDDLERLGEAAESWSVIAAFIRHASVATRVVLVSRRDPPATCELPAPPTTARVSAAALAFTDVEAQAALEYRDRHDLDPRAAVAATGGWVTGVLSCTWRSQDQAVSRGGATGRGGDLDPLPQYLATQVIDALGAADRTFLIATSVLDVVTAERAAALGQADAHARLASLAQAHLPAALSYNPPSLRCHPCLRDALRALFSRWTDREITGVQLAYGRLLLAEGRPEEATEALLRAGADDEARAPMEVAILPVVERLDFDTARRWLTHLAPSGRVGSAAFSAADLMIGWADENYHELERIADRLAASGPASPIPGTGCTAALVAWCYYMRGRVDDAQRVLADAAGPDVEAVRYLVGGGRDRDARPQLSGGALDLFVLFADYFAGRLQLPQESAPLSPWGRRAVAAQQVAVLRATGQTRAARAAYEAALSDFGEPSGMLTFLGPDVYVDSGDGAAAREVIAGARERFARMGADGWHAAIALAEARLELRIARDPQAARRVLDRIDGNPLVAGWLFRSAVDVWYGFALLLEDDDAAALTRLQRAVDLMSTSDGHIELPTAAVYLAEALWRVGRAGEANDAADLALAAASAQQSNHLLLQALRDVPQVVTRRIAAERCPDSAWHLVGRTLALDGGCAGPPNPTVRIQEFGALTITVAGVPVQISLSKSGELLALLMTRPDATATREALLHHLFDGRDDPSSRAYLRQAIHKLREALPPDLLQADRMRVWITDTTSVETDSQRLLGDLVEARRYRGPMRLDALSRALAIGDAGSYLPAGTSEWVDARRRQLARARTDARAMAADEAFRLGRYGDADVLCHQVLEEDPFRESAWRVRMRIAMAHGDDDAALIAYHGCAQTLHQLGIAPSPATRAILGRAAGPTP